MKRVNKVYVLVAAIALMFSMKSNAQIKKAEIRATGLTCSMCSNAINKQLKSLPEVISVETDLNTNTFIVLLKDNKLTPKIFKDKVEKAGFFIGSLTITLKSEIANKAPYVFVENKEVSSSDVQVQVLDKGYVTDKEFKKLSKSYKNVATYAANNEDDFHTKILN